MLIGLLVFSLFLLLLGCILILDAFKEGEANKMVNCPNCGRTIRVKYIPNPTRTAIIERTICHCGCVTTATYKLSKEITQTADGTLVSHRKGNE